MSNEEKNAPPVFPAAISRALRQAEAHPSVIAVEATTVDNGLVLAKVTIRTELPAAWRAKAESPFGVRAFETVTFGFAPNFPLTAPYIALRSDFSRIHPHINPGAKGKPVRPCLVLGSPREVVQARGFLGLVEQMVLWLERAAELDLNDPKHGWEPVRRDSIDDIIVIDEEQARALVTSDGGTRFALMSYLHYANPDIYKAYLGTNAVTMGSTLASFLKRDQDEVNPGGVGLGIFAWAGSNADGPIVQGFYLPETVENLGDLRDRAAIYGCGAELDAALDQVAVTLLGNPRTESVPIAIVLLARRPYNLIGADSPIEICPYLIEGEPGEDIRQADTKVRLAAHREAINVSLLRRASRDSSPSTTSRWTMVGCGSVGSKIVLHSARGGRGPSVLVDRGYLDAHNYARHSALPLGGADRLMLRYKSDVVAEQMVKLAQDATGVTEDAVTLIGSDEGRAKLAPEGTRLIVDTTASIVTREALAHAEWPERPRAAEACLMGGGKIGYLALEGANANPNLSDLVTETYRRMAEQPGIARTVFGAEAEAVAVGQGCSSATFPMPDHELSFLSAALAQPIVSWAADGVPEKALTRVGVTDGNGGLAWQDHEEPEWLIVQSGSSTPSVRIHPRVDAVIRADVARYERVETGGVLVGRFSTVGNCFQIVDLIPAPPDSERSGHEFLLGREGLKAAATRLAERTGGALQVVGTWHSHLRPSGPSTTDAVAGAILAIRQFVPALLLIHTPAGYSALIADAMFGGSPEQPKPAKRRSRLVKGRRGGTRSR